MTSSTQEDLNALMYAAYHNHVGVANVLIEYNCDLNTTDYVRSDTYREMRAQLSMFA